MLSTLAALAGPLTGLLDQFIEDKDKKNALVHEIATMADRHSQEQVLAQLAINKTEAAHKSLFVSGWRPAIGWCCGFSLFYSTILAPFLGIWVEVPEIDSTLLTSTMLGMLGLVGARSYEKVKKVSREK
jgi:hypothetical protein|tara:strand:- start:30 stop:416 length:387 start_codon:yes stop_codon:yes gene_type:complete